MGVIRIFLRPGQQIKKFNVYRKGSSKDSKGRVTFKHNATLIGTIFGSISKANQKEMDRWKQVEHPVSHSIVTEGISIVQAEDILELDENKYYVQGKDNPGGISAFEIIYCNQVMGVD